MTIAPTRRMPFTSEADVRFDEVAPKQWRVLDTRVPQGDATAVLGFVCVVAGLFEVTFMARPLDIEFCADERAARLAFVDVPEPQLPATLKQLA